MTSDPAYLLALTLAAVLYVTLAWVDERLGGRVTRKSDVIDPLKAKVGFAVFYQQPHMRSPEYGTIKSVDYAPQFIHVLFLGDTTAKACRPADLHWPPDFCAADRVNPPGQPFEKEKRA